MERLNIYFPPRSRHFPLKMPSRITEGTLYIRIFAYAVYARVMNGIAAGVALASTFLEKAARGGSGAAHGGKISTPSKIVSSRIRSGAAAGGKVPSMAEKGAAGYVGVRAGGGIFGGARTVRFRRLSEMDGLRLSEMDGQRFSETNCGQRSWQSCSPG